MREEEKGEDHGPEDRDPIASRARFAKDGGGEPQGRQKEDHRETQIHPHRLPRDQSGEKGRRGQTHQ